MKRVLSLFLVLITLVLLAALPAQAASKNAPETPCDLFVQVPGNKAKTLKLTWYYPGDGAPADGFEVYRSASGKKDSYQKIATVTDEVYVDEGLKNQKQYFYKVRAFAAVNGKTVYSPFTEEYGVTKLSKAYLQKKLRTAYALLEKWIMVTPDYCDYGKPVTVREKVRDDNGKTYVREESFCPIKSRTFTTKAKLTAYLGRYFVKWRVKEFVDFYYIEKNGRLYVREAGWGDGAGQDTDKSVIRDVVQRSRTVTFSVLETWEDMYGEFSDLRVHSMYFDDTNWVFEDDAWFPLTY